MVSVREQSAFSLVELSIVLVILGLLVGGVLAGQSLIRAAELRAVGQERQRYLTAVQIFRDKYFGLPGDLPNGTAFWGMQVAAGAPTNCLSSVGAAVSANGTCDSPAHMAGNGQMNWWDQQRSAEIFQFWRQLALAGLIEGQYSGLTGAGSYHQHVPGTNTPLSKYKRLVWSVGPRIAGGGIQNWTPAATPNSMIIGTINVANGWPMGGGFNAEDAWNIDTKADDGRPGSGSIHGANNNPCRTGTDPATSTYNLGSSSSDCFLEFIQDF